MSRTEKLHSSGEKTADPSCGPTVLTRSRLREGSPVALLPLPETMRAAKGISRECRTTAFE